MYCYITGKPFDVIVFLRLVSLINTKVYLCSKSDRENNFNVTAFYFICLIMIWPVCNHWYFQKRIAVSVVKYDIWNGAMVNSKEFYPKV